ncbi:MAG: hypothetical protein HQL94_04970 [Magnetococcales bacterium]|nr:hypothetical protein [Magnetococcales bacterium]
MNMSQTAQTDLPYSGLPQQTRKERRPDTWDSFLDALRAALASDEVPPVFRNHGGRVPNQDLSNQDF